MDFRQHRLRVLSSIAIGIMAFCLTIPVVSIIGGMLFSTSLRRDVLFPQQTAILILAAIFAGLAVGISAGIKYFRYLFK